MKLECPHCKAPVARERQRFCYRCGNELTAFYDGLGQSSDNLENEAVQYESTRGDEAGAAPDPGSITDSNSLNTTLETLKPASQTETHAHLRILLPTGDVFDRDLNRVETQLGKGPRNDIVITDTAVSTAHALVRCEGDRYLISDLGSRNGTFVNGDRIAEPRMLQHGDVIGMGLSKLTFRFSGYTETEYIRTTEILATPTVPQTPPPLNEESVARALLSAGLVKKQILEEIRARAGQGLYHALIEQNAISEQALRDLMSKTFKLPTVDLGAAEIDDGLAARFSPRTARAHFVFPLSLDSRRLSLAVADPTDTSAIETVKQEMHVDVELQLATRKEILDKINRHFSPKLIGVLPSGEKLEFLITQTEVEIGKAAHNRIVLIDPTVSNTHAVIIVRDASYSIVDLGSRNGTFVNSERLGSQARTLRHGDTIQLGQTVLIFRNPDESAENITTTLPLEVLKEVRSRARIEPPSGDLGSAEGERQSPAPASLPAVDATPADVTPQPASTDPVSPVNGALSTVVPAEGASEEEKAAKKKKKKKKEKNERLRAAYVGAVSRILAQILAVGVAAGLAIYISRPAASPNLGTAPVGTVTSPERSRLTAPGPLVQFQGISFEPSGAAQVPGADGIVVISDNDPGSLFWMQMDQEGRQQGDIKSIPLGATIADPEAITYGGGYFYMIGSQSDPRAGATNALARFTIDSGTYTVQGKVEVVPDLRSFLISNVAELRGEGERSGQDGGLNVEGIAWDFERERLLLGLRSPLGGDQALLIPLKLKDPRGAFSVENLALDNPPLIRLSLSGMGIRDITWDSRLKSFLIISGAPETMPKVDFKLWSWNGEVDQGVMAQPREEAVLNQDVKPEGIARVRFGGRDFVLIVGDTGSYFKLDYLNGS